MKHQERAQIRNESMATRPATCSRLHLRAKRSSGSFPILQVFVLLLIFFGQYVAADWGQEAKGLLAAYISRAENGDLQSQLFLGVMYDKGIAVDPDPAEAFYWIRAAADSGDTRGLSLVGRAYGAGRGVTRDNEEALLWFHKSAQALLGEFALEKTTAFGGTAESLVQAAESRKGRHDLAKVWAGMMYLTGQGVEQSDTEAVRWLKVGLEEDHPYARPLLALMYEEGRGGLPKDTAEAMRLYREHAEEEVEGFRWALEVTCLSMTGQPDCSGTPSDHKGRFFTGSVSGDVYTSPRGLFTIRIPEPANWAGVPFEIRDSFESGRPNYDVVTLYVDDFGEVLLAGVRQIPDDVLARLTKHDPRTVLENLAYKVLYDWRSDFAEEPGVVEDTFVETQFGEAILRVYSARKGSLLKRIEGNREPERFDTEIIVLLAQQNNYLICAIDEYDATPLQGEARTAEGKARIQRFFSGIVVPQQFPFDRE